MSNNQENTPAYIFDWIEKRSFGTLLPAEQQEVLEHLSESTYKELHGAAIASRRFLRPPVAPRQQQIKEQLTARFDMKHKPGIISLLHQPVAFWKVAAILLLMISGGAGLYMMQQEAVPVQLVSTIDTLYITKETPPVTLYDTIYITKESKRKRIPEAQEPSPEAEQKESVADFAGSYTMDSMNIMSMADLDETPNKRKKRSKRDDTLSRKYEFVTL
ncbi:MAG: hypothetical protein EOP49_14680 [Sphingobacteriales bacterium]|nr:MAG: hypothetical protein EOP49_14680 [Sphingobacteriales bacterium]